MARFTFNCRNPNQKRCGPLTTSEISGQRLFWIKRAQPSCDLEEDRLRLKLKPNVDGILECRGRIQARYHVYVPDANFLATKLVEDFHLRTLHGGIGKTMTHVRGKFWIPRLRQLIRKVIKGYYGCRRFQAKTLEQPVPGSLLIERTEGNRPFQAVGVDFTGPLKYKKSTKTEGKAYIALYACRLTRAVYIDLLSSLNTREFLQSLKRFIARRGRPQKIYSDYGKTFMAAAKWLKVVQADEKLQNFLGLEQLLHSTRCCLLDTTQCLNWKHITKKR